MLGEAGEAGVAGVVGWDEGPFAFAVDEGPAVLGFLAMVVAAQAVEEVEGGVVGLGVVVAMVVLEPVRDEQPWAAQVGYRKSRAERWWALGWRPWW